MSPITHVSSVALAVPDLAASTAFYRDLWRLEPVDRDGDCTYFGAACPEDHVLRLRQTDDPRVDRITFAVADRAAVDALVERVGRAGGRVASAPGPRPGRGGGYGAEVFDVDGRLLELVADRARRPHQELVAGDSRPRSISHVVFNTPDMTATSRWYQEVLGFRVSDYVADFFCFLRTGPSHHIVALAQSPDVSLNHVSFELRGLDEFMRGTGRLMRQGVQPVWGPGRHGAGDNTFAYFREPTAGFVMEYTTALQQIDDEHGWTPKVWGATPEETDQWGTSNPFGDDVFRVLHGSPTGGRWLVPPE